MTSTSPTISPTTVPAWLNIDAVVDAQERERISELVARMRAFMAEAIELAQEVRPTLHFLSYIDCYGIDDISALFASATGADEIDELANLVGFLFQPEMSTLTKESAVYCAKRWELTVPGLSEAVSEIRK